MKRFCTLLILAGALAACATPMTTLKHPKTGQVATCGGSRTGSVAGGMIGYSMQKGDDEKCVQAYENQGFKVMTTEVEK